MYSKSKIKVKWKDSVSVPFDVANGIKQGYVLSPILFTLLLDDLLFQLDKSGDGCSEELVLISMRVWDMLMISNCNVQVLKA